MPRIYSYDGDLTELDELLQTAVGYLKGKKLKSFSFALLESIEETFFIDCGNLFAGEKMLCLSPATQLLQIIQKEFPSEGCGMKLEDITKGRIFGEDAEFRWEPRYPTFTFLFFATGTSHDSIDSFSCCMDIETSPICETQYLWGERKEDGKYKEARIPRDLVYPCVENHAAVVVEEYWSGWCRIFSRFCKLEGQKEMTHFYIGGR